jgi:phosphotransferase system IIA component
MSYCRFSDGDVYLYYSVKGMFVCCGCLLHEGKNVEMDTLFETIKHLNKHVEKGDKVPEYAFERLKEEAIEEITEIIKKQE